MAESTEQPSPPRAFTQGVGTVFQFVGGMLFLASMTVCCASSFLFKETAKREDLTRIGWHLPGNAPGWPALSGQRMISIGLVAAVGSGLAVAGLGLGLQATYVSAARVAVVVCPLMTIWWGVEAAFAVMVLRSVVIAVLFGGLTVAFGVLSALAVGALRDLAKNPPAKDHDVIPPGTKVPYSWYHDDPPDVRLAQELEQRRQKLAVQQKELEQLEARARKAAEEREREQRRG